MSRKHYKKIIFSFFLFSLFVNTNKIFSSETTDFFSLLTHTYESYQHGPNEKESAEHISNLYNFLQQKNEIPSEAYLTKIKNNLKNSILFTNYLDWVNHLVEVKKTSDPEKIISTCQLAISKVSKKIKRETNSVCIYKYLETYLSKNRKIETQDRFIKDNIKIILAKKNFKFLSPYLKNLQNKNGDSFLAFSSIIKSFYISNGLYPSGRIINLLSKDEQFSNYIADLKRSDEIHKNYIAFRRMIENFNKNIDTESADIQLKKIEVMISFYIQNELYRYYSKSVNDLQNFGKKLLSRKKFNLTNIVFKSLADINYDKIKERSIFNYIWNSIYQEDYENASKLIFKYGLQAQFDKLPVNTQFWVAYTLYKSDQQNIAKNYFEKIMKNNPLSFYFIASSKIIGMTANSTISTSKFKNLSSIQSFKLAPNVENIIKRIKIWELTKNNPFIEAETANLKQLNNNDLLQNITVNDDERIFITALVQIVIGDHISSFNTIYKGISKQTLELNDTILKTLFPTNYEFSIKNITSSIDPSIVLSIIRQESAFNPNALSSAGARGLMQLMPKTAKMLDKKIQKNHLNNPQTNIKIGTAYLQRLLKKYNSNLIFTLAAYNAGEGNLKNWMNNYLGHSSTLHLIESIPFTETRNYVRLIYRNIYFYKLLKTDFKNENDPKEIERIFDLNLLGSREVLPISTKI